MSSSQQTDNMNSSKQKKRRTRRKKKIREERDELLFECKDCHEVFRSFIAMIDHHDLCKFRLPQAKVRFEGKGKGKGKAKQIKEMSSAEGEEREGMSSAKGKETMEMSSGKGEEREEMVNPVPVSSYAQKLVEELENMIPPELRDDGYLDYLLDACSKTSPQYDHVLASPLLQVLSVTVSSDILGDGHLCSLFGTIRVRDCLGNTTHLYNTHKDSPDEICIGDSLCLSGVPFDVANLSPHHLEFSLFALADNNQAYLIATGTYLLTHDAANDFGKIKKATVEGRHGSATLRYVLLQHAVVASVKVKCTSGEGSVCGGRIFATYGDQFPVYGSSVRSPDIILFHKRREGTEALDIKAGDHLPVSTFPIGVPAYSSIKITLDLLVSGQLMSGTFEFIAYHSGFYRKYVAEGNCTLEVETAWSPRFASIGFPKARIVEPLPATSMRYISPLLEVFSIVCSESRFQGKVTMTDAARKLVLDSGDMSAHSSSGIISVGGSCNRCFRATEFEMKLDLTDAMGRAVSHGWVCHDFMSYEKISYKPLCSVVRGEHGYAAVHYVILGHAMLSQIKVGLACRSSQGQAISGGSLSGRIVAYYSCCRSSRSTQQEDPSYHWYDGYYETVLFEAEPSQPMPLEESNFSAIQLKKECLAVPLGCELVVSCSLVVDRMHTTGERIRITGDIRLSCKQKGSFRAHHPQNDAPHCPEKLMVEFKGRNGATLSASIQGSLF